MQLDFARLNERLLCGGIAPRHVRRYIAELRDHFDDLVDDGVRGGATRADAQAEAQRRLGSEDELAHVMMERPELRALTKRHPWAVFGLGPVVLLAGGLAAAILLEGGALTLIGAVYRNPHHLPPPSWFMDALAAWNALPTIAGPLVIAGFLLLAGLRLGVSRGWIATGVIVTCVLGGFQELTFTETGYHGELELASGLVPPFPHMTLGIVRATINLLLVGSAAWILSRRRARATHAQPAE
jgi:hypothetical protein